MHAHNDPFSFGLLIFGLCLSLWALYELGRRWDDNP